MLLGVLLAVVSAATHATWNLIVKRSGSGDTVHVWCYAAVAVPFAVAVLLWDLVHGWGPAPWAGAASAVLHTAYAVSLQKAFTVGDLGVVYPVARGAAPVFVAVLAVPLLGEAITVMLVVGVVGVTVGVALTATRSRGSEGVWTGVLAGLAVALATTAYTLWDGWSMDELGAAVMTYLALQSLMTAVILSIVVYPRRGRIPEVLRRRWRDVLVVAVLMPLTYGLVLLAMTFTPTAVVAAARSVSIAFTVALAAFVLHEEQTWRQRLGALVIVGGVVAVAFA